MKLHKYRDSRARRLATQARVMAGAAIILAVLEGMGIVGSGGTITTIHMLIGTVAGLVGLASVGSFCIAGWLERGKPAAPARPTPPGRATGRPAPVAPIPPTMPIAAASAAPKPSPRPTVAPAPAVVEPVETPESVPVA
jgi:hypothetical protein